MTWSDACLEFLAPGLVPFFVVGHNKSLLARRTTQRRCEPLGTPPALPYTTAHLDHHVTSQLRVGGTGYFRRSRTEPN